MSSFLRQLSSKEGWKSNSKRWVSGNGGDGTHFDGACWEAHKNGVEMGMGMYGCGGGHHYHDVYNGYDTNEGMMTSAKKRVMVVVDETSRSKHAMMWALTHVTNNGDWLTLLHVISPSSSSSSSSSSSTPTLATSLASLCKACKPQVEVEAIVIQGPKLATVLNQVKKLEASVLVLGQKKPSPIMTCLFGASSKEGFVNECIKNAECLTIGVRKQSKGMGGYLISTRWQKNFWLLA